MKIEILIPQYEEDDNIVKPLLDSIALQQNIDFSEIGVIICNDGSDTFLSEDLVHSYPFKIDYYIEPHRGVSGTRNACLDYAIADYVMFCDADDMFYNMCGMWIIFQEIEKGFDSFVSAFVEETKNFETGEKIYINRELDSTFVHGKVHRRKYLTDNNIRFNDNLTIHEDGFFNVLAQNCSDNVKYCPTSFYLWRWRDESVCRHDPKYILKTFNNLIDSNDELIEEFNRRDMGDRAKLFAVNLVFEAYYMMNKPEWVEQENKEYRYTTERRFAEYFDKYRRFWDSTTEQEKMFISSSVRGRNVMEGMQMENMTIKDWLKEVERSKNDR